jgi:hypothetical protein
MPSIGVARCGSRQPPASALGGSRPGTPRPQVADPSNADDDRVEVEVHGARADVAVRERLDLVQRRGAETDGTGVARAEYGAMSWRFGSFWIQST